MGATLQVVAGDTGVFLGDSITFFGWYSVSGGVVDQINATWPAPTPAYFFAQCTGTQAACTGTRATHQQSTPVRKSIVAINSGVVGNTVQDLEANVNARVIALNPSFIILHIGINNCDGVGSPSPAAFQTSLTNLFNAIVAWKPTIRMLVVGMLCDGEKWDDQTGWTANGLPDTNIANLEPILASTAATFGFAYHNLRVPLLAFEQINNATPVVGHVHGAADGVMTGAGDGIHPTVAGQLWMCGQAMLSIQVSP